MRNARAVLPGQLLPARSLKPRPCGSEDRYCPAGSSAPILADAGAYTTPQMASAWAHPEAPYCMASEGANCTAAAIASRPLAPRQTGIQQCEPGHFCIHGIKFRCPGGRYGSEHELKTPNCTAACPAGTYCPEGSLEPSLLPAGRYSPKKELRSWNQASLCPVLPAARPHRHIVRRGAWRPCWLKSARPRHDSAGDASSRCPAGYVCPSGTAVSTSIKCSPRALTHSSFGAQRATSERGARPWRRPWRGGFCPRGSASSSRAPGLLFYRSRHKTAVIERRRPKGRGPMRGGPPLCEGIRHPRPAGRGATSGLDNARCSAPAPGYYCPVGPSRTSTPAVGRRLLPCRVLNHLRVKATTVRRYW